MIMITKENVVEYVRMRLPFFHQEGPTTVSMIGEGSVEEDGDGFINFVYRVSDGEHHLISVINYVIFSWFDCIEDNDLRTKAKYLSVDMDRMLFEKWDSYENIGQFISDLIDIMGQHMR